jgi:hypothetical protein
MFCPVCRSEYRPGFTRCATCEVDLVERLDSTGAGVVDGGEPEDREDPGALLDFCGFLDLEEARNARDLLWRERIRSEVVIRDGPGSRPGAERTDEYWIRVGVKQVRRVADLLGYDAAESEAEAAAALHCPSCGFEVASEETFCPQCGARFGE